MYVSPQRRTSTWQGAKADPIGVDDWPRHGVAGSVLLEGTYNTFLCGRFREQDLSSFFGRVIALESMSSNVKETVVVP